MKREGGVSVLNDSDQVAANQFFGTLEKYGLFAVGQGEVENWLSELAVPGKKTDWTISMLQRLGDDPLDGEYVRPSSGDVWDFMRRIVEWVNNPARSGTL